MKKTIAYWNVCELKFWEAHTQIFLVQFVSYNSKKQLHDRSMLKFWRLIIYLLSFMYTRWITVINLWAMKVIVNYWWMVWCDLNMGGNLPMMSRQRSRTQCPCPPIPMQPRRSKRGRKSMFQRSCPTSPQLKIKCWSEVTSRWVVMLQLAQIRGRRVCGQGSWINIMKREATTQNGLCGQHKAVGIPSSLRSENFVDTTLKFL
jgi:hypothetical protein